MKSLKFINWATICYACLFLIISLGRFDLIEEFQLFVRILKFVGSAYMVFIAFRIIAFDEEIISPEGTKGSFTEGVLMQWINPITWISILMGVSIFVNSHESITKFIVIILVVGWVSKAMWVVMGYRISNILTSPKQAKLFNKMLGVLLAGSAINILVSN